MIGKSAGLVQRVLVLELGGIGDSILSVPALMAIRRKFPEADITVLTIPRTRAVLERIDESLRSEPAESRRGISLVSAGLSRGFPRTTADLAFFLSLRRRKFDLLVDLSAIESASAGKKRMLLVKCIGARTSVGRDTCGRGGFFDSSTPEDLDSPRHEMDRKLDVAGLLGARSPLSAPIFPVRDREREEAARFLRAHAIGEGDLLAAMHPSGTGANKRWPAERFAKAGAWLSDNLGARVLVVGGDESRNLLEKVSGLAGGSRLIPASSLSLGAVAVLLERASLFLTNDSGPMHLAAALGVPTVAVFGQTNHERYLPLLPPSRRELAFADADRCSRGWSGGPRDECGRTRCKNPTCLSAVTVEEVIGKMEALAARIGLFYSTQMAVWPGDTTAGGFRGEEKSKADHGLITRKARGLSLRLLDGIEGPILDVACGKGFLLEDLACGAPGQESLWGVDISMEQLKRAGARLLRGADAPNGKKRVGLVCGDVSSLPFRSGFFSASLCVNTLQNLGANGKLAGYLAEISRVTKPGGTVLLEVRNSRNPLVALRFFLGRVLRSIPLRVHALGHVLDAGRECGLSLRARQAVGPGRGPLAYSFILVFSKEGNPCSPKSPR
jgi:heptosyltransferase-2